MNITTKAACALLPFVFACNSSVEGGETPPTETCVDVDANVSVSFIVGAGAWPLEGGDDPVGGAPQTRTVLSACTVASIVTSAGGAAIDLLCNDADVTDATMKIALDSLPADFELALSDGMPLQVAYYWQSDGHHISSGEWLVIHDDSGSDVLLSAIDHSGVVYVGEQIAPLSLDTDDASCANPCEDNDASCAEPQRLGVVVEALGGERTVVLDGNRGALETSEQSFDIMVGRAHGYTCLNCSHRFAVLIAAAPE